MRRALGALWLLIAVLAAAGRVAAAERLELQVEGMVCPFCEATVERVLGSQPGVLEADASFLTGTAVVVYDPTKNDPQRIVAALSTRTFYRARPVAAGEAFAPPARGSGWTVWAGLGVAALLAGGVGLAVWRRRQRPDA